MRKILFVGFCLLAMSVTAFGTMNFKLWGGLTTVSMAEVNKEVDDLYETFKDFKEVIEGAGGKVTLDYSKFGLGIVVGADFGFEVITGLSIGPRVEFIYCFPLSLKFKGEYSGTTLVDTEMTMNASLIPVMAGGVYSLKPMENLSLDMGLYLGWGFANVNSISKDKLNNISLEVPASGSGFVADILAGIKYEVSKGINLGLDLGYRYARIAEVKATKDVADAGVKAGDVMEDSNGNPLPFDFSGFNIALSFGISF